MQDLERLVELYDRHAISRRALLGGLVALSLGPRPAQGSGGLLSGRTINHVSLEVSDVARSKEFYQRMLALSVREEGPDFCEFRLENGFLGLYVEPDRSHGIDHVAIGIDGYEPATVLEKLKSEFPTSKPSLEHGDQIYFRDPDGARIQLCSVDYKR
jgi:catechol 2,3-dioxygenase-like lactoylglutathione lyase family enzyme